MMCIDVGHCPSIPIMASLNLINYIIDFLKSPQVSNEFQNQYAPNIMFVSYLKVAQLLTVN